VSQAPLSLGLDLGSSHCKAGLFARDGSPVALAARPMPVQRESGGRATLDPAAVWRIAAEALRSVAAAAHGIPIASLGVAGMAESGLLVDTGSGLPRSPLILWFDTAAAAQAEQLARLSDPFERFVRTGLRISYKVGLAKILWLREQDPGVLDGAVWLSAADFIAFRLTGRIATDPTLAARTGAYRIDVGAWDGALVAELGIETALFPEVVRSGELIGEVTPAAAAEAHLPAGLPVAIAGHDHVCAAFAVGALREGVAFDSMGTAESLVGAAPRRELDLTAYESGLVFCRAVGGIEEDNLFWMGALSSSGGALDWLRHQLSEPPLDYEEVDALLRALPPGAGDLLYFPYLLGAQAPDPDPGARGAFVGLSAGHGRAELIRAVLEGVAYEMETIRRAAERTVGARIRHIVAAGGGTRVPGWLQIKADLAGSPIAVSGHPEATLVGAAVLAGISAGVWTSGEQALAATAQEAPAVYQPDTRRLIRYQHILENAYLPLQRPLRQASRALAGSRRIAYS
jgi:sugar (pentulose or hexulose) kinase